MRRRIPTCNAAIMTRIAAWMPLRDTYPTLRTRLRWSFAVVALAVAQSGSGCQSSDSGVRSDVGGNQGSPAGAGIGGDAGPVGGGDDVAGAAVSGGAATEAGQGGAQSGGGGDTPSAGAGSTDPFGVRQIIPTKSGGREWFMNRDDVLGDGVFKSVVAPTPNGDGTWHIVTLRPGEPNEGARMDVTTPAGSANWLNIEMTGYVRLVANSSDQELAWRTTSGTPHTNACDGYAYYGTLLYTGASAAFLKEVWHPNGYKTSPKRAMNPTTPLKGRWVGFKILRYNVAANTQVHLELWLDDTADNQWRKLLEDVDDGWAAGNAFPDGSNCQNPLTGAPKTLNVVMTWPYPLVTFRADNSEFDFDKLSVREIEPPTP